MALTIKLDRGKADITAVSPSGNPSRLVYGPPVNGHTQTRSVSIFQTTDTYRWLQDEETPGTASRTDWAYGEEDLTP